MIICTGVGLAHFDVFPVPLTNTRPTSVGENDTTTSTGAFKGFNPNGAKKSGANLQGSSGDSDCRLELKVRFLSFIGKGGGARHVLIGRVGAKINEGDLDPMSPVVLLGLDSELRDGRRAIRVNGPLM